MVYMLQYVRGTVAKVIIFSGIVDMHVFKGRSTTEYIFFAAGGPIAWQSKLQTTVSTSSMQSDYQAMNAGMQELVWLWGVLGELQMALCKTGISHDVQAYSHYVSLGAWACIPRWSVWVGEVSVDRLWGFLPN